MTAVELTCWLRNPKENRPPKLLRAPACATPLPPFRVERHSDMNRSAKALLPDLLKRSLNGCKSHYETFGKAGMPSKVLGKPAALDEASAMKSHPILGAQLHHGLPICFRTPNFFQSLRTLCTAITNVAMEPAISDRLDGEAIPAPTRVHVLKRSRGGNYQRRELPARASNGSLVSLHSRTPTRMTERDRVGDRPADNKGGARQCSQLKPDCITRVCRRGGNGVWPLGVAWDRSVRAVCGIGCGGSLQEPRAASPGSARYAEGSH